MVENLEKQYRAQKDQKEERRDNYIKKHKKHI